MTDVFISTMATHPMRIGMAISTLARWSQEEGVSIRVLDFGADAAVPTKGVRVSVVRSDDSDRLRRVLAENGAESEVYVLADDDCLPLGDGFLGRSLKAMRFHSDYGMLCALPVTPEVKIPEGAGSVFDLGAVGGIRFIRKGALRKFPSSEGWRGYDGAHCKAMREAGWRVGYMRHIRMNHLGWQYSTEGQ